MKTQKVGNEGENTAQNFLIRQGYSILERNFRSRFGELDIIAREKNQIVFVEVKTRSSSLYGHGVEAIGAKKLRGLIATAHMYLSSHRLSNFSYRFDAIEVGIQTNQEPIINHIKNITL